jgi:hypothetical protein
MHLPTLSQNVPPFMLQAVPASSSLSLVAPLPLQTLPLQSPGEGSAAGVPGKALLGSQNVVPRSQVQAWQSVETGHCESIVHPPHLPLPSQFRVPCDPHFWSLAAAAS